MSRFEGSITVTNNAGNNNLVTVPISKNTWSEVSTAVETAINNGLNGAQQVVTDWQGAQGAFNS